MPAPLARSWYILSPPVSTRATDKYYGCVWSVIMDLEKLFTNGDSRRIRIQIKRFCKVEIVDYDLPQKGLPRFLEWLVVLLCSFLRGIFL